MKLEACVGSLEEALKAEKLGAHQIELCDRLDLDGTSPSLELIKNVSSQLTIPIKVIVNPNPFNYTYSSKDIQKILLYIRQLDRLPIQGIVFGPLTPDDLPDEAAIKTIADSTHLPITYHKAIDVSNDIIKSTKILAEQNIVKFILTSGGKTTALEGADQLKVMKSILKDSDIQIIAAGKITTQNLGKLDDLLDLSYYHGKKIVGDLNPNN